MSVFCDHGSDTCVHKSQRISRVTVSLRIMTLYISVNFVFVAIYVVINKSQVFFVLGGIIESVSFITDPSRAALSHSKPASAEISRDNRYAQGSYKRNAAVRV